MKLNLLKSQYFYLSILLIFFITACNQIKKVPPFPIEENEYRQPIITSFEFPKPDTLAWVTKDLLKNGHFPSKKFSWNKLPSIPLDIEKPYRLKKPLTTKPFNWDSLPSTPFSLESLPTKDLEIKISVLDAPKIVKATNPIISPEASRGVMQIDGNFGLPGTNFCSTKDKNGMLWFGTRNGIARYDSENIEIYGEDQGLNVSTVYSMFFDSNEKLWITDNSYNTLIIDFEINLIYQVSISNSVLDVYGMMEDNEGRIWYANRDFGYIIVNLKENWSKQLSLSHGLLGNFNINPFQDNDGFIWLSSNNGTNILDLKEGKNYTLTEQNGLLDNFVSSFYQDHDGKIWITGDDGIQILDKDKTSISYFTEEEGLEGLTGSSEVIQDKTGKYYIGSMNGLLFTYDASKDLLERYQLNNRDRQFVFNLMEDNQGQIWASIAQGGLFMLNLKTGKPGNYTDSNGLTDSNVWRTLVAKDHKVWIGTEGGIDIYDPESEATKHIGFKEGLADDYTYALMEDRKGKIWASGNNVGVSIIDLENETIEKFTNTEGLEANSIRYLIEDNSGIIWLGGNPGELHKLNLENSTYNTLAIDTSRTQDLNNVIFEDSNNMIWVGSRNNGLQKIDPINNIRVRLTTNQGLIDDQIMAIIEDKQQNIWVATIKGVQKIDVKNQTFTTFTIDEGIGANDVYDIIYQKGRFFLGTSNGITVLKPIEKEAERQTYWEVSTIGKKQGINEPDISQNSIGFDKNGRLWAGGNALQLIVMDEIKEDTSAYPTVITGINIMDKKRSFIDKNLLIEKRSNIDTLWNKNRAYKNNNTKDSSYLAINKIQWNKIKGSHNIPTDLILPYTQNYLSFNFNGGQFANPDKLVYRYILEGIDKNWSPITKKTQSENYRDLPPGPYNFKVASKGFNGVWSNPTELKFTIRPPWWQSWWAYTIFVVLFLGLGLVILHYRSKWLIKENKILEEKVSHRTEQLENTISELENTQSQLIHSEKMASLGELTAGIAHEIQNPMNFINNFSDVSNELMDEMIEELDKGELKEAKEISKDIAQNLKKITHHGKRASSIVKGMLEHSRNTSGKKESTDINMLADEYLRLSYHGLRAKNKSFNADFKTDLDQTLPLVNVIPQDLGRVLLNLLNNAFYAVTALAEQKRDENYKPLVTVRTKNMKDQVLISVKDNGAGISKDIKEKIFQPFFTTKPTGKGTGLGLSLAYDIITQGHGGAIELNTNPGKGTEFSIYIPLKD